MPAGGCLAPRYGRLLTRGIRGVHIVSITTFGVDPGGYAEKRTDLRGPQPHPTARARQTPPRTGGKQGETLMPVDDHDLDGAYTTAEAAEKLKVSVVTVKRMIRDGELEVYRVRGRVFIPHRSVLVYVNSTRTPPASSGKGKR